MVDEQLIEAQIVPEQAPIEGADAPIPDARSRKGCLEGLRFGDKVTLTKVDNSCSCTLDLGDTDVKSARQIADILSAVCEGA